MHVKANNAQVVEMTLTLGLHGAWRGYFQADATEALASSVTLTIGDSLSFVGTAPRTGEHLGRAKLKVVGGSNGLDESVGGKTYYLAPIRVVVADLLAAGGETLSSLSDSTMLATAPKHWARAKGTVRDELEVLADHFGFSWRVLPNGEIWIGSEDWSTSPLTDYQIMRDEREDGLVEIAAEIPSVLPGETFLDRHVEEVTHTLSEGILRTEVRFAA